MRTVNIHEAKTHLSRLVEQAAEGDPFVIAKAGRPLVKVVALDAPAAGQAKRLGFMAGRIAVPDDFDRMGAPRSTGSSAMTREAVTRYSSALVGGGSAGPLVEDCAGTARRGEQ
jgi:prevent-host-death family protein